MRILTLVAVLGLAFGPLALAKHPEGECGGKASDGLGKTEQCKCDERPYCGQEGDCECTADGTCQDNCGGPATVADVLGSTKLPAFEPATAD